MVATWVDDLISLRTPGQLVVEHGDVGSAVTMICPICWSRCHSIVGVLSVSPVSLSDKIVCHGCLTEFSVQDDRVSTEA